MEAKDCVRQGYNAIADTYLQWIHQRPTLHFEKLELVLKHLGNHSRVLDLGCGAGKPITQRLCESVDHVVGVDISEKQIELAKQNAPKAELIVGDMASLSLEPASFDAVLSFYAIFHLPRDEHGAVLKKIHSWLKPGGLMLITMTATAIEGGRSDFHGAQNYFSGWDTERSEKLVKDNGFEIINGEVRAQGDVENPEDPDNNTSFLWIFARKT